VHQICARQTWTHIEHIEPFPLPLADRGGRRHGAPGNKGTVNGASKLTEAQVWEIRSKRAAGDTYASLASQFGVGYSTVWKLCNDQSWVHLRKPRSRAVSPEVPRPGIYLHHQDVPAAVWTVVHFLHYFPANVLVIDSSHRLVIGGDIEHLDIDALVLRFGAAFGGLVQCR
jgi:hypothetical protein